MGCCHQLVRAPELFQAFLLAQEEASLLLLAVECPLLQGQQVLLLLLVLLEGFASACASWERLLLLLRGHFVLQQYPYHRWQLQALG